jgi:hypothetical protein
MGFGRGGLYSLTLRPDLFYDFLELVARALGPSEGILERFDHGPRLRPAVGVEAADKGPLAGLVERYGRVGLLLIGQLGSVQLNSRGAELLFQALTEREEKSFIELASNFPLSTAALLVLADRPCHRMSGCRPVKRCADGPPDARRSAPLPARHSGAGLCDCGGPCGHGPPGTCCRYHQGNKRPH